MKTFTRLFTMLAVAAFVAAGCVNEEPPYKEEPKPTPGDATGFLSVSGLSMRVVYDETDVRPDDTSDQTQSPQAVSGTRAEQPDVDGFIVEILDADDAQVLKKTYAELKQHRKNFARRAVIPTAEEMQRNRNMISLVRDRKIM